MNQGGDRLDVVVFGLECLEQDELLYAFERLQLAIVNGECGDGTIGRRSGIDGRDGRVQDFDLILLAARLLWPRKDFTQSGQILSVGDHNG